MRIFLVRHGESIQGKKGLYQSPNTGLYRTGIKQAEKLAARFKGVEIDLIISSRYRRAMQSAQIVGRELDKKVVYTKLLNESVPPSEVLGRVHDSDGVARIWKERMMHIKNPKWHYSDEENLSDLKARALMALKYIAGKKAGSVLAVTHGNMLKMLIGLAMLGEDAEAKQLLKIMRFLHVNNTGITECEIDSKGNWQMLTFNDYTHLK